MHCVPGKYRYIALPAADLVPAVHVVDVKHSPPGKHLHLAWVDLVPAPPGGDLHTALAQPDPQ